KTNMTPPESRDSTSARPGKHNKDEAEERDLKNCFMKMIKTHKEERRKPFKEIEENTKKYMKWRKRQTKNSRNKSLKK
ncbi:hypothetical protein ACQP3F_34660, partial [Escherichia coli]